VESSLIGNSIETGQLNVLVLFKIQSPSKLFQALLAFFGAG
jgi:hypothetical protein